MSEFNHNGRQESLMQIFMSDHRELFGFVKNYDSPFFFVLFVICLLRYYVYIFYVTRTILGLTFLHPDTNENRFPIPIPIHTHMRHLHYVRVGCCIGAMLTPGFFPFFSINRLQRTVSPVRAELRFELPFEVFREVSQP